MIPYLKSHPASLAAIIIFAIISTFGLSDLAVHNTQTVTALVQLGWFVCTIALGAWLGQDYQRKKTAGKI
jgi:hypothetical protein